LELLLYAARQEAKQNSQEKKLASGWREQDMAQQVGMLYAMSHREDKSCCNFFHDHVHIFMPIIRHGCQKKVLLSKSPFQSVTKRQGPDNDVKVGRGHLSI